MLRRRLSESLTLMPKSHFPGVPSNDCKIAMAGSASSTLATLDTNFPMKPVEIKARASSVL